MRLASAAALAGIALCLVARVAADPPAAGKAVPTADLPRIGTVGDFPTEPFVEVSVAADGGIYVDGELCDLFGLRVRLAAKAAGLQETDTGQSRLSVVLRVAAATRWEVVIWVEQVAASVSVRVHRLYFAVRAEEDEVEGALASFNPRDGSFRAPGPRRRAVRLEVDGTSTDTAQTPSFPAIRAAVERAGDGAVGLLRPSADASAGAALEAADLLFRAGATAVFWTGSSTSPPPAPRVPRLAGAPTSVQRHVAAAGPAAPGHRTWIVARGAAPATDSTPAPKVARVRGRTVGTLDGEAVKDVDFEKERAPPEPGPEARTIEAGLLWLAAHQSQDGAWPSQSFTRWCRLKPTEPQVDGSGRAGYDVGTTGLALLAFLGAGYTNRSDDPNGFGKAVASGLRYLKNVQDRDGCFGPRQGTHWLYSHMIASIAVLEAYGRTRSSVYKHPANLGLAFTASARNPDGAWRYGVRPGDGDTSVTFWAGLGVHTARSIVESEKEEGRDAGLTLDPKALDGIAAWLERVTDPETGRVGYASRGTGPSRYGRAVQEFPAGKSESTTAAGAFFLLAAGGDPTGEPLRKGLSLIDGLPPSWNPGDGSIDLSYWHPAALATAVRGGTAWQRALAKALLPSQRTDGDVCGPKGSWDPIDAWGDEGGRIYMTATACLCLEAPARVARLMGRER